MRRSTLLGGGLAALGLAAVLALLVLADPGRMGGWAVPAAAAAAAVACVGRDVWRAG
jgi:hypothetical protein